VSFYLRFIDAPDMMAAAARHLGLTTYHVKVLGDDYYEADDGHGGARGVYRVLEVVSVGACCSRGAATAARFWAP
jgi:hypothetical protein